MGRVKQLKPFVKVYVGLILAFFVSMALVFCIPDSWIQNNVNSSIEIMDGEGSYPMYFFYRHNSIMDVHTEGVMYNGLIPNRDYNPIQASVPQILAWIYAVSAAAECAVPDYGDPVSWHAGISDSAVLECVDDREEDQAGLCSTVCTVNCHRKCGVVVCMSAVFIYISGIICVHRGSDEQV